MMVLTTVAKSWKKRALECWKKKPGGEEEAEDGGKWTEGYLEMNTGGLKRTPPSQIAGFNVEAG